ncbi:S8 family serine peptidase [Corynebacterium pseudotuberculosis 258]|uniref:S8 family serine peptidase n=1 Tax=Corynebacterium pseudotuberculosis 258 TaxID=1168865 RepID=A0AAU8PP57_CORPS|nr:S8 family peptidase [Corynebacterium pseudotuberculosis]AEQ07162.2 S8 family serine peptidase [Corynebacterium pseudotuberculosis CIP 52.97]AFK17260.1 S8 family serine peptidase [Corynebacterium pseudotuberculosis 258]
MKIHPSRTVFSRSGGVSVACAAITCVSLVAAAAPALSVEEPDDSLAVVQRQSAAPAGEAPATRFIVTFNRMTTLDQAKRMKILDKIVKEFSSDASFVRQMFDGSYVVELDPPVPAERIPSLRGALESKAEIAYADIDRVQYSASLAEPNDEHYKFQWHLFDQFGANVDKAWATGADGAETVIAVVDSGITRHADLNSKVLPGYDMISDPKISQDHDGRDNDPTDMGDWTYQGACGRNSRATNSSWHGTHVAGIAAAVTDNHEGVAGVAPNAKILPVRALGRCGGYTSDIADAIVWASGEEVPGVPRNDNPADVINLSLGGQSRCMLIYQNAIDRALSRGATIAVAAGNEDQSTENVQPASCSGVITVGATGPEGHRAVYSNFGRNVVIGAPGGNMHPAFGNHNPGGGILSTVNRGLRGAETSGYSYMEGTSMATPVVSGVIALMKAADPTISPEEIERILRDTARRYTAEPGAGQRKTAHGMGAGLIDAHAAVCAVAARSGRNCDDVRRSPKPSKTTEPVATEPVVEKTPEPISADPVPVELNPSDSLSPEEDLPILETEPAPVIPEEPLPIVRQPKERSGRERTGKEQSKQQQCTRFERLLPWKKCS